jgi:predicted DCC family thiol-disulfide oxidoreductase YuxK
MLFYDGVCAMCNGIVKCMLRIDEDHLFHFAPLQGETAELARKLHPEFPTAIETVVYVRRGEVFVRSRAVALAMQPMPYPAKALSWVRFLPAWLTTITAHSRPKGIARGFSLRSRPATRCKQMSHLFGRHSPVLLR